MDALPFQGGAENVLAAVLELFPGAPIYTHIYNHMAFRGTIIENHPIHTSFINKLPFSKRYHRSYLPLYPLATEQFDLSKYDLILSFSYAVAHGILASPEQLHISYKFTVMRHAWHGYHDFLRGRNSRSPGSSWLAWLILHYFRIWDAASAGRVDYFLAASQWVSQGIQRVYQRHSRVIYPPVDVESYKADQSREDYYLAVSRLEAHKGVEILVDAFSQLGYPLVIIGDGSLHKSLRRSAAPNVKLLGRVSDEEVQQYLGRAKAFVHAAVDDFGIAAVEAQAAGCPVIALARGGLLESIVDGKTGVFYPEQSVESLMQAVERFQQGEICFHPGEIRRNAQRFSKPRFQDEYYSFVEKALGDCSKKGSTIVSAE
jgi:glycosyltransferase involved in cell wall biosynthesis